MPGRDLILDSVIDKTEIMKIQSLLFVLILALSHWSCSVLKNNTSKNLLKIIQKEDQNRVDVLVGDDLITSYQWPESIFKPVLYPIRTLDGKEVTRGFPIAPREGERADHKHHVGMWLNYGNVNGIDFWGHGAEGLTRSNLGTIEHGEIQEFSSNNNTGKLKVSATWVGPMGNDMIAEETAFNFRVVDNYTFLIDRTTTLTAVNGNANFNDTKEGSFAIRVNRNLELPSEGGVTVLEKEGEEWKKVKKESNKNVSGNYLNSYGVTGLEVWGKRARWVSLSGEIDGNEVSLIIFDHPENVNYPTYWHARGYGLFSANPFGVKDFTDGDEELNFSIDNGTSFTMKYRTIICSGKTLSDEEINALADEFGRPNGSF